MISLFDPLAAAAPRTHHFDGTLAEAGAACVRELWQISLRLQAPDGRSLYVYLAPGRGDAGALACSLQLAALQVGRRYHGSATLRRQGEHHDYYAGHVALALDQRRPAPVRLHLATHKGLPAHTGGAA